VLLGDAAVLLMDCLGVGLGEEAERLAEASGVDGDRVPIVRFRQFGREDARTPERLESVGWRRAAAMCG
jgi:hypothetical protein